MLVYYYHYCCCCYCFYYYYHYYYCCYYCYYNYYYYYCYYYLYYFEKLASRKCVTHIVYIKYFYASPPINICHAQLLYFTNHRQQN